MRVRIRLFAMLRERAGTPELEVDLPEGARVRDALAAVEHLAGGLSLVLAVNREYARPEDLLHAGDELAVVPPVSGGQDVHVLITEEPLDRHEDLRADVRDPRAGAVVTFEGVTREVDFLDYEAYVDMASVAISRIAQEAVARHGLCAVSVGHCVGRVGREESSVVVVVSAPHRAEAFAGAREVIDRIKAEAPIWKKEPEGWVEGSTPRP